MGSMIFHARSSARRMPLIRLPAPSPCKRGEGICGTVAAHAGARHNSTASSFSPFTGRRCRQADEGRPGTKPRRCTLPRAQEPAR